MHSAWLAFRTHPTEISVKNCWPYFMINPTPPNYKHPKIFIRLLLGLENLKQIKKQVDYVSIFCELQ